MPRDELRFGKRLRTCGGTEGLGFPSPTGSMICVAGPKRGQGPAYGEHGSVKQWRRRFVSNPFCFARPTAALTEGATVREAAARFAVSVASGVRIGELARAGQGLEAKKRSSQRPLMLLSAADEITARLASKSDWAVRTLAVDLRTAGIAVSHGTVWRFMRRQGLSFKKNAAG